MEDRPKVELIGANGNVFNIIGLCKRAAKKTGWKPDAVEELATELMSCHSYDEVLQKVISKFDVC